MKRQTIYRVDSEDHPCISPSRIDEVWTLLYQFIPDADKPFENNKGRRIIPQSVKWLGRIRGNQITLDDVRHMETYLRDIITQGREKWTKDAPQIFTTDKVNQGFQSGALATIGLAERILNSYMETFNESVAEAEELDEYLEDPDGYSERPD